MPVPFSLTLCGRMREEVTDHGNRTYKIILDSSRSCQEKNLSLKC